MWIPEPIDFRVVLGTIEGSGATTPLRDDEYLAKRLSVQTGPESPFVSISDPGRSGFAAKAIIDVHGAAGVKFEVNLNGTGAPGARQAGNGNALFGWE
jgi:hypothetical protein